MKTVQNFKDLLFENGENTLLGMHMQYLFNESHLAKSDVHNLEDKIEVICQMDINGIDCFTDSYKMGSVSKAYYQWQLAKYDSY
jgi:hypothetical protein